MVANVAAAASRLSVGKVTIVIVMGAPSIMEMMESLFGNLLTGISPSSGFECSRQR